MKPKPFVTSAFIVAGLDGPTPRHLCRHAKHGHWVVTTEHQKAAPFKTQAEAIAAAADFRRLGFGRHHTRPGHGRAYAMSIRVTLVEPLAAAA